MSTSPPVPVPGAVVLFVSYAESGPALEAFLADLAGGCPSASAEG